jgi:H+/Cl- antiporter ClcA
MRMEKIYCFIICKLSDTFPPIGGTVGAISQAKTFHYLPTWEAIISTIIIGVVGGIIGYIVKLSLDFAFRNFKKKYKI